MTKTIQELQAAVDALRAVCQQHGVVLLGTCSSEGIYGEITIAPARADAISWRHARQHLTNRVDVGDEAYGVRGFAVQGIGDLESIADFPIKIENGPAQRGRDYKVTIQARRGRYLGQFQCMASGELLLDAAPGLACAALRDMCVREAGGDDVTIIGATAREMP